MPELRVSLNAWWWCPECGILRQVPGPDPSGGPLDAPRCEINGAGTQMEQVSDGLAAHLLDVNKRASRLERCAREVLHAMSDDESAAALSRLRLVLDE